MQDDKYWFWTSEMAELEKLYEFDVGGEYQGGEFALKNFIANHRVLLPLLKEIPIKIKEYFPDSLGVVLSLEYDPECYGKQLSVDIKWDDKQRGNNFDSWYKQHRIEEDKFNEEWWFDNWMPTKNWEEHIHIMTW